MLNDPTRSSVPTHDGGPSSQQEAQQRAYVEFGAGKGYLGLALVDAAPGAALVLVDKGTFRLPADRCASLVYASDQRDQDQPRADGGAQRLLLVAKGTFRLPADRHACCLHTCCLCINIWDQDAPRADGGARRLAW